MRQKTAGTSARAKPFEGERGEAGLNQVHREIGRRAGNMGMEQVGGKFSE